MTYNAKIYGQLLSETLPATIETEADRQRVLPIISDLMRKGANMSPEQARLLRLLASLVAGYEAKSFSFKPLAPEILLKTLLEERELKQKDLLPIFGSEGVISDVLAGRRAIDKKKAQELGSFFNVSYKLFCKIGGIHKIKKAQDLSLASFVFLLTDVTQKRLERNPSRLQ